MVIDCLECKQSRANYARGLCATCFRTPGVKDKYPIRHRGYGRSKAVRQEAEAERARLKKETMEDLERMIAEQMTCLPDWWFDDCERSKSVESDSVPVIVRRMVKSTVRRAI